MARKIKLTSRAKWDIDQAIIYYSEEAGDKVVNGFILEIERAMDTVLLNAHFQIVEKNYRALPLRKFPYTMFYEFLEAENTIKILSFFHNKQSPSKRP